MRTKVIKLDCSSKFRSKSSYCATDGGIDFERRRLVDGAVLW